MKRLHTLIHTFLQCAQIELTVSYLQNTSLFIYLWEMCLACNLVELVLHYVGQRLEEKGSVRSIDLTVITC
jgi:hypothetical protein